MAKSQIEIIKKIEAEARIKKAEAEARITKPPKVLSSKRSAFLNKGRLGGGGCEEVTLFTTYDGSEYHLWRYDHIGLLKIPMTGDNSRLTHGLAMWGNKFYIVNNDCSNPSLNSIIEYEADYSTNTYVYVRDIQLNYPGYVTYTCGGQVGMTMKNANTAIIHEWTGSSAPGISQPLAVLDISGSSATLVQPIYNLFIVSADPLTSNGDLVYYPDTNRILVGVSGNFGPGMGPSGSGTSIGFVLADLATGNIIDFMCSWCDPINQYYIQSIAMYKYGGKTYAAGLHNNCGSCAGFSGIREVIVSGNTISVGNEWDPNQWSAQSGGYTPVTWQNADSACAITTTTPSNECYDIGDTGPEGGTIFAVPLGHPQNIGLNQSDYYYEVAANDIATAGTPQGCFNDSCGGGEIYTHVLLGPYAATHQHVDDNLLSLFWNPGPFPNVAYPGVGSNPPLQVGDVVTASSSNGFPIFFDTSGNPLQSTTIASIVPNATVSSAGLGPVEFTVTDEFSPLMDPASNYNFSNLFSFTVTTVGASPCSGWTVVGSEWGAYDKQNIQTSNDFGFGQKNTDIIDAYPQPPNGGVHPVLDTHDIAATLCKQQGTVTGLDDWFLPSQMEFWYMNYQLGDPSTSTFALSSYAANQLMLTTTPGALSQQYYWTSSKEIPVNTPIPDEEKYAWTFNASNGSLELAFRCHALSVRPIRRFKCKVEPPKPPCDSFPVSDLPECLTYNFIATNLVVDFVPGAIILTSSNWDYTNDVWEYVPASNSTPGSPTPASYNNFDPWEVDGRNKIGGDVLHVNMSKFDMLAHEYSMSDWGDDSQGYTITIWDRQGHFLGKWRYDSFATTAGQLDRPGSNFFPGYPTGVTGNLAEAANYPQYTWLDSIRLVLTNVTHLEGPDPVLYFGAATGSSNSMNQNTNCFIKIENASTSSVPLATPADRIVRGNPFPHNYTGNPTSQQGVNIYGGSGGPQDHHGMNPGKCFKVLDSRGNPDSWYGGALCGPTSVTSKVVPWFSPIDNIGTNSSGTVFPTYWEATASNGFLGECGCCDEGEFNIGDVGPAGGIIVATPNMSSGTVTPNGVAENNTNYYFELGPVDLGVAEWGNSQISSFAQQNLPWEGEGEKNSNEMLNNYSPIPSVLPNADIAFDLCDNYVLNGYNDWFLPSVEEMFFVRNNTSGWGVSHYNNLYWTSNFRDDNYPLSAYATPLSIMYNTGQYTNGTTAAIGGSYGGVITGPGAALNQNNLALASDLTEPIVQDPGTGNLATGVTVAVDLFRSQSNKVRPMRKFQCAPSVPEHCWRWCSFSLTNGTTVGGWSATTSQTWFQGAAVLHGPISLFGGSYDDFYNYVLTQVGSNGLTVGNNVFLDVSPSFFPAGMIWPDAVSGLCLVYMGLQTTFSPVTITTSSAMNSTVVAGSCCSGGSSSAKIIETIESNQLEIKKLPEVNKLSKRKKFKNKSTKKVPLTKKVNKQKTSKPFGILGYYPLYYGMDDAIKKSPQSNYQIHDFDGQEYYMPEGLEVGVTRFSGDWDGQIVPETPAQPKVTKIAPTVVTPEPEPKYVPPSPTRSSGDGGGSGGY